MKNNTKLSILYKDLEVTENKIVSEITDNFKEFESLILRFEQKLEENMDILDSWREDVYDIKSE